MELLEKSTGVPHYRKVPRGIDLFDDVNTHLPNVPISVIFDVGANTGQSAKSYLKRFSNVIIYCFEPVQSTFRELQNNLRNHNNVTAWQLALGASKGTGTMVLEGPSEMFFLLNTVKGRSVENALLEEVQVDTLDGFCAERTIGHINFLKVDTEGGDLDVVAGAAGMLASHQVDIVEVEAGMNPGNKKHVPFEKLKGFFEYRGYFLFGIYEQISEWPTRQPHLRRSNPVFISEKVITANRKPFD